MRFKVEGDDVEDESKGEKVSKHVAYAADLENVTDLEQVTELEQVADF